jgi:hypothetical protein
MFEEFEMFEPWYLRFEIWDLGYLGNLTDG